MDASKRAKLWKRTWVGGSIAAALALTLWGAHELASGWPILIVGSALTLVSVFELGRMGKLAHRDLTWILAPAACAVILSTGDATRAFYGESAEDRARWLGYWQGTLASEYLWAVVVAAIVHTILATVRPLARFRPWLQLGVVVLALGWLWTILVRPTEPPERLYLVFGAAALVTVRSLLRGPYWRTDFLIAIGLAAWALVPLPALTKVWYLFGETGLIALVVLSKIGDIAGYYAGSAFGRHHPFPTISPGKTTEGCLASLVAGVLGGVGVVAVGLVQSTSLGLLGGALAGAAINLAAQAGDLFESWVKRRAGVKDASTWFGPSGGMLDLVDSLLFSVPVALWVWPHVFDLAQV
ncbi:MAG: phosphatidate cytidylyltransferase [Planctomycetes bacterium]|nr:phosphatidate cytidylyltransferase [Planctomycetota bacterium]